MEAIRGKASFSYMLNLGTLSSREQTPCRYWVGFGSFVFPWAINASKNLIK